MGPAHREASDSVHWMDESPPATGTVPASRADALAVTHGPTDGANGQSHEAAAAMSFWADGIPHASKGGGAATTHASLPFNQSVSDLMKAQGMHDPEIAAAWTSVQQQTAAAYGTVVDMSGSVQRSLYGLQDAIDKAQAARSTATVTSLRAKATTTIASAGDKMDTMVHAAILHAAVAAIEGKVKRKMPSLHDDVAAALGGALPKMSLAGINFGAGSSKDVRLAITNAFDGYRAAVQTALEKLAGTAFRPYVRADAGGLHLDMLTEADQAAKLAKDDAAAGAGPRKLHAGHLQADAASAADLQSMMWDVYQYQQSSNDGHDLVNKMVGGTGMKFDVLMHAVSGAADVDRDAFIDNRVDIADIHKDPRRPPIGSTAHPQSQESVYAHFLHERYFDATHSATNMKPIADQATTLETQRKALIARLNALPANVRTALGGGRPSAPLSPAEVVAAQSFASSFKTWHDAKAANDAAFTARFDPAHDDAIDRENDFNRERGFDDSRPD